MFKRLMRYFRPFRFFLALSITMLVISKGIEAYVPIFIGRVTQQIFTDKHIFLPMILKSCFAIIGLQLCTYILDATNVFLKSWVGQKALYTLRTEVYEHIQRMPLRYYDRHAVGKLMTNTIHDVDQINQMFAESVVPLLGSSILFICICIGLVTVDWRVAVVLAVVLPVIFWLTNNFRYYQRRCYDKVRTIVSSMNAFIQEHLMGASTVRTFGLEKQEQERFEKINEDHCNAYLETIRHFSLFFAGIDFVKSFSLISVFVVLVVFEPFDTEFQVGTYFTFSLYILMLFGPLYDLAERYNVLQSAMAAASRIFDVLDQKTEDLE